jgi:prevent-host-death family protein
MTITLINTADAKEEFSELIHRVSHNKERVVLTRRGKEIAAIVPIDDLLVLQETEAKIDLSEAIDALNEARNKGTIDLDQLKEELGDHS